MSPYAYGLLAAFAAGCVLGAWAVYAFLRQDAQPGSPSDPAVVDSIAAAGDQATTAAQAKAHEVLAHAPDADIDARVTQLRDRGKSGK